MVGMQQNNVLRKCLHKCSYEEIFIFYNPFVCLKLSKRQFIHNGWIDCETEQIIPASCYELYSECYGTGNSNNEHQSMAVYENEFFCFEDGAKCRVYDSSTFSVLAYCDLEEDSHHNNAQMTDLYYSESDEYPLLLLSRGDYPPNHNSFYFVRITKDSSGYSFKIVKTIHNSLLEAHNNGSWIVDSKNKYLYLYCMDNGDFRTVVNNHFCIFQFKLPELSNKETDYYLSYSDVINRWSFPYLVLQGGTSYKGSLFFNVQGLTEIGGRNIDWDICADV